jgi:hypothetical protein
VMTARWWSLPASYANTPPQVELGKALRNLSRSSHAFLFVGSKVVATCQVRSLSICNVWCRSHDCLLQKPDYAELNPQDLFLLQLYVQSEFHPLERDVLVDEVPIADYTR